MPTLLENLVIDRVDLCDEGANSAAFIELFKRKGCDDMGVQDVIEKLTPEHSKIIQDAIDEFKAEISAITKGRDDAVASFYSTKKELDEATARLEEVEKMLAELKKAADEQEDDEDTQDGSGAGHPAGCNCPSCMAEKDRKSSGNASFDQTETFKNMPKEVQEYLNTIKAQKEAAEAELRKSREEAAEAEAVAKASALKAIPYDNAKLVAIIKTATPELLELLEIVNAAIEGTVLGEVGKSAVNSDGAASADAWAKIEAKADELAKTASISKAKAVSRVISENPDLYREYLEGGAN